MRLTLQREAGSALAFWVTRRQWLGLLRALGDMPPAVVGDEPEQPPAAAQSRPKPAAGGADEAAVPLKAIRLRRYKGGVKLVLVMNDDQGVFIDVPTTGVAQLLGMLRQQAERAGWDVEAALARLSSAQLASAAVKKARLH